MRDTTVAIASFNTLPLLKAVCGAVRETAPDADLLVIDTGSTDGSREWSRKRRYLRLEALDGAGIGAAAHGAALDRALALCDRSVLATLDSDAVPRDEAWLETWRAELDRAPAAAASGTTKDRSDLSATRRFLARLMGAEPGPEWSYLRPNRAIYRVDVARRLGMGFGGRDGRVGEALGRALAATSGGVRLIAPERMEGLVLHLRHATLALNPKLFPSARARDVRAAKDRVDRFLASPLAERWTSAAEA
jgi:hypothetical protein